MTYTCPICHQPLKGNQKFSNINLYLQTHTTKFLCEAHDITFSLYVHTSNPNEIVSFYLYSPKLTFYNTMLEGNYYWKGKYYWRIHANDNTLTSGEKLFDFPQALTLLNRYQNLLAFS